MAPPKATKQDKRLVRNSLQEVLRQVDALPNPTIGKMIPALVRAQHELERDLRAWLAKEQGANRFTAQRYRSALLGIRTALARVREIAPLAVDGMKESADLAGALAMEQLRTEAARYASVFEGTILPIDLDTASIYTDSNKILFPRYDRYAQRYVGAVEKSIKQALILGRVRGESVFELTNRLEKELPRVFVKQSGWAYRLAQTESMNSYNTYAHEGLKQALEDDEDMLMRWDASFDRRRCVICADLDGRVVQIEGKFTANWAAAGKSRTMSVERPPIHPRCRCVLVPWNKRWEDLPGEEWPQRG